jgi:hypothetical protein
MLKCPIYNTTNACDVNNNCLFLRDGGCAIVLAATIAEENKRTMASIMGQIDALDYKLRLIGNHLNLNL